MSLDIANNLSAMDAHRWMQINDANTSTAIERLSSGYQINSAADDAAGLVVSESFQTSIEGMQQATKNTTDAINMMKTAESALDGQETQLQTIRNLVLDASNNVGNTDALAADQAEIDQSVTAIDRIATQTKFGTISLLNSGSGNNINGRTFQLGDQTGEGVTFTLPTTFNGTTISGDMTALSLGITQSAGGAGPTATGSSAYVAGGAATNTNFLDITYTHANGTTQHVVAAYAANTTAANVATAINTSINNALGAGFAVDTNANGFMATTDVTGKIVIRATTANTADQSVNAKVSVVGYSNDATAVTGFESGQTDTGSSNTTRLLDVTANGANYDNYLEVVDTALAKVNGLRVNLGAFESENLENNLNRLSVSQQNLQSSESAVKDTDMAAEMVQYTSSNILTQAGQAMMTQANTASNNILQMLRNG